ASGEHAALLREALTEGEPCPVCGSREHELSALAVYLSAQVEEARERARALEGEAENRRQELAGLAERRKQAARRRKELQEQAEAQARAAEAARREAEELGEEVSRTAASLGLDTATQDLARQIEAQLADAEVAYGKAME